MSSVKYVYCSYSNYNVFTKFRICNSFSSSKVTPDMSTHHTGMDLELQWICLNQFARIYKLVVSVKCVKHNNLVLLHVDDSYYLQGIPLNKRFHQLLTQYSSEVVHLLKIVCNHSRCII